MKLPQFVERILCSVLWHDWEPEARIEATASFDRGENTYEWTQEWCPLCGSRRVVDVRLLRAPTESGEPAVIFH